MLMKTQLTYRHHKRSTNQTYWHFPTTTQVLEHKNPENVPNTTAKRE
jgi:hypothetical protein